MFKILKSFSHDVKCSFFFLINKNNKLFWPNQLETLKILGYPANSVFTFLFLFIHRPKRKINFPAFFLFKIPKRSQFTDVDNILSKPKKHQFLWKLDSLQDSPRAPGLHMSFKMSRTIHCAFFKFIISDSNEFITANHNFLLNYTSVTEFLKYRKIK